MTQLDLREQEITGAAQPAPQIKKLTTSSTKKRWQVIGVGDSTL